MTKSDLIERLALDMKLPKAKAEHVVNTVFACMEQALQEDARIEIRGLGSFEVRKYRSYQGRNPRTGVAVPVKEKRLPFFKAGKDLRERINEGFARKAVQALRDADRPAPLGRLAQNADGSDAGIDDDEERATDADATSGSQADAATGAS
jgi:integration host factor subunit beta